MTTPTNAGQTGLTEQEGKAACERFMFTPGPWGIYEDSPDTSVYCDDVVGNRVADCGANHFIPMEQQRANAKLIAAAPEMLDCLVKVDSIFGGIRHVPADSLVTISITAELMVKISQVINKATK